MLIRSFNQDTTILGQAMLHTDYNVASPSNSLNKTA